MAGKPCARCSRSRNRLAGQLVEAVLGLPLRAIDRRVLGDRQDLRGRVDHRRAREDVVAGAAAEDLDHALDVLGAVGRDVVDAVELLACEDVAHAGVIRAIAEQSADAAGKARLCLAAVEDRDLVAVPGELVHEREPVEARTAHDQHPHRSPSLVARRARHATMLADAEAGAAARCDAGRGRHGCSCSSPRLPGRPFRGGASCAAVAAAVCRLGACRAAPRRPAPQSTPPTSRSTRGTCASRTDPSRPCAASTSRSGAARSTRCSGPTARARRRFSRSSRAAASAAAARRGCSGTTRRATSARSRSASASSCRQRARSRT